MVVEHVRLYFRCDAPLTFYFGAGKILLQCLKPGVLANRSTVWKASTLVEQVCQLVILGEGNLLRAAAVWAE